MNGPLSVKAAARTMRDRAEKGWVRNNFWLSPEAVAVLDQVRVEMGFTNREMAVNAILERISKDGNLEREIVAATG
jgi:hypothetical protein